MSKTQALYDAIYKFVWPKEFAKLEHDRKLLYSAMRKIEAGEASHIEIVKNTKTQAGFHWEKVGFHWEFSTYGPAIYYLLDDNEVVLGKVYSYGADKWYWSSHSGQPWAANAGPTSFEEAKASVEAFVRRVGLVGVKDDTAK